ncbi:MULTISPECIES: DsbA family protein [Photorhabdus]|uniref:Thioredoxin domain-containing protein n=2 Tax=Photorhabdus TaxID=29487 RepID=A0AAW6BKB4_9GAMM|nr:MULTISPECIES: thioredoxin domain-containing protein [Photorhabdus]EYU15104.1 protein-disulfide isomerase [Photorhabdus aegyptia]MDB6373948.1 thioredoxin domain-containing protein [Photorhabdus bodei]
MKNTTSLKWVLFGLPFAALAGAASFIAYTLHNQDRLLNDLAVIVDTHKTVVNNRTELEQAFSQYINASGLKVSGLDTSGNAGGSMGYRTGHQSETAYTPSTDNERIYGNPDAQFFVLEYSDYECPYCKEHFPQVLDLVDSSSGNIALVFKHIPVHGQASRTEALAAECAAEQGGNPAFFNMSRAIFRYTQSDGRGMSVPLDQVARETGLNDKRLLGCVNAARPSAKIAEDVQEAGRLNIQKTPTNIVTYGDKSAMVQGAVSGTGLMQMMAQLAEGDSK